MVQYVEEREKAVRYHNNYTEKLLDEALFSEVIFQSEMIENIKLEKIKYQMIAASFTAWQMGAGKGKAFNEYIKKFNLLESDKPLSEDQKISMAKDALLRAEKIKISDRKRRIK